MLRGVDGGDDLVVFVDARHPMRPLVRRMGGSGSTARTEPCVEGVYARLANLDGIHLKSVSAEVQMSIQRQ